MTSPAPLPPNTDRGRGLGSALITVLGLALLAAVATWGITGPLHTTVRDGRGVVEDPDLDYVLRAPEVDRGLELTVGGVAVVLTGIIAAATLRSARRAGRTTAGVVPIAAATLAGVVIGGGGRIITAGGIGANIGAGLWIMFGLPFAAALIAVALIRVRR